MSKKPFLIIGVVLVILGAIYFLVTCQHATNETAQLKIGAILPLSGKSQEWGERVKKGIDLALEESPKDQNSISVIFEDSQGSVNMAVQAANKLINIDKVNILICQLGDVCGAIAPISQEKKIVTLGFTDSPDFTQQSEFTFNMRGDARRAGAVLADYAAQNYKSVAIIYLNNATHQALNSGFVETFEKNGGKILLNEIHNDADMDFRTALTKIKQNPPEVLLFSSRPKNLIQIIKQAREFGFNQPIISTLGIDTKDFIDGLQELANGIVYPTATLKKDIADPVLITALERYKNKYNETLPLWSAESYDAIKLLNKISNAKVNDSDGIKQQLLNTVDFPGLSGNLSFNENRTVNKEYVLYQIKDGQFVPLEN